MRSPMLVLIAAVAACGDGAGAPADAPVALQDGSHIEPDAGPRPDAAVPDASAPDAAGPDAAALGPDATSLPLAGFGELTGLCNVLNDPELLGTTPALFEVDLAFADRYDDPVDRPLLTAGGVEMILDGNAGGSSVYSEVFAFEVLARCELAGLLKTETEIIYDIEGKKTDILVEIDGHKIGVSVTRAMTFPFGSPYTVEAATTLIDRKLDDALLATAAVSAADRWEKQILAILAYDDQHAEVAAQVWAGLDEATRADTIVVLIPTAGDDLFIYTDQ